MKIKKIFKKSLKNLLTKSRIHGIINTSKGQGKVLKTRKENTMKKNTMQTLVSYFAQQNFLPSDVADAVDEMKAELAKNEAKAQSNRELYATSHDVVIGALTDKPVTLAELWETVKDTVPEGMTKSKVQYALRELWASEVVKIEGKVNEYRKA